jgi:hypothetical protein
MKNACLYNASTEVNKFLEGIYRTTYTSFI